MPGRECRLQHCLRKLPASSCGDGCASPLPGMTASISTPDSMARLGRRVVNGSCALYAGSDPAVCGIVPAPLKCSARHISQVAPVASPAVRGVESAELGAMASPPRTRPGRRASSIHEAALFTADSGADRIVGTMLSQGESAVLQDIASTETFVRQLPDVDVRCRKVNRRGRKQNRVLRLRATRIVNSKPDGSVTKTFHYNEVISATLDDTHTLRIRFTTDHAFLYIMVRAVRACKAGAVHTQRASCRTPPLLRHTCVWR